MLSRFQLNRYGSAIPPHLARSRPFTQQIDVVFEAAASLEDALAKLSATYARSRTTLSDFIRRFARPHLQASESSNIIACSVGLNPDAWCIDQRGLLTMRVCKETYHRLGLLGEPSRNNSKEIYYVRISFKNETTSTAVRLKQEQALAILDRIRQETDGVEWDVLYHCSSDGDTPTSDLKAADVAIRRADSVHIPKFDDSPRTRLPEEVEDWELSVSSIFEWTALAALGSQRLRANDSIDPLVAVYESPLGSSIGSVVHMRWHGLLPPVFVQNILDVAAAFLADLPTGMSPFVSITGHSFVTPVNYLPTRVASTTNAKEQPKAAACVRAEDTWSLIMAKGSSVMVQSAL